MAIDKFTRETVIGSSELVTALQNKAPDCPECGKRMFVHATEEIQHGRAVYWCLNFKQHPAKPIQLTLTDAALEKVLAEDQHDRTDNQTTAKVDRRSGANSTGPAKVSIPTDAAASSS